MSYPSWMHVSPLHPPATTLASVVMGRDNNLNLIRVLAASAVLISHSFALSTGDAATEPMRGWAGMSLGDLAVDIFFVLSGLLVTASLLRSQSLLDFACGRVLRIFPGLWVMLLVCAFALGPIYTTLPLDQYLTGSSLRNFLLRASTLLGGVGTRELPGVFQEGAFRSVNGSLWTLPFEVYMYLSLGVLWAIANSLKLPLRTQRVALLAGVIVLGIGAIAGHILAPTLLKTRVALLGYMFFSGSLAYHFRDKVTLEWKRMAVLALALVACGIASRTSFFVAYVLLLPYLLLHLAYLPRGLLRQYNQVGDYSYGVYIYAFPLQQAIAHSIPGISPMSLTLSAGGATIACALLSWHMIEKPVLSRRGPAIERLTRLRPSSSGASTSVGAR